MQQRNSEEHKNIWSTEVRVGRGGRALISDFIGTRNSKQRQKPLCRRPPVHQELVENGRAFGGLIRARACAYKRACEACLSASSMILRLRRRGQIVAQVAAGWYHSLALTATGLQLLLPSPSPPSSSLGQSHRRSDNTEDHAGAVEQRDERHSEGLLPLPLSLLFSKPSRGRLGHNTANRNRSGDTEDAAQRGPLPYGCF